MSAYSGRVIALNRGVSLSWSVFQFLFRLNDIKSHYPRDLTYYYSNNNNLKSQGRVN